MKKISADPGEVLAGWPNESSEMRAMRIETALGNAVAVLNGNLGEMGGFGPGFGLDEDFDAARRAVWQYQYALANRNPSS